MMKLSRRGFAGFAAALPFAGNAVSREMAAKQRDVALQGWSPIGGNSGMGIAEGALYGNAVNPAPTPKMEHWQAMRLALQDPDIRREIMAECYARHKIVNALDPDIANKRSWSDMAKITFQRQRNVERDIEQMTQVSTLGFAGKLLQNFIQKAMWGRA